MQEYRENIESLEDLGRAGFRLIQPRQGFRFGEDSALLAYFAAEEAQHKKHGARILELGTNCGAASILLAARRTDVRIDGVEIDVQATEVFRRNIRMNRLEDRVRAFAADLRDEESLSALLQKASYDMVFFNPPFYTPGHGPASTGRNANNGRQEARYEVNGSVRDFIRAAEKYLVPQGKMVMVHRARKLPEVMSVMTASRIEPQKLRFVHPRKEKAATLFMLSGQKHANPGGFRTLPPLILYRSELEYSEEMRQIYDD